MPLINLSIDHGRSLPEAKTALDLVVKQVRARFGLLMQRVDWNTDRSAVKMSGPGFSIDLQVDAKQVHLTGDIPLLGGLLGSPMIASLKQIVRHEFQKRLGGGK